MLPRLSPPASRLVNLLGDIQPPATRGIERFANMGSPRIASAVRHLSIPAGPVIRRPSSGPGGRRRWSVADTLRAPCNFLEGGAGPALGRALRREREGEALLRKPPHVITEEAGERPATRVKIADGIGDERWKRGMDGNDLRAEKLFPHDSGHRQGRQQMVAFTCARES